VIGLLRNEAVRKRILAPISYDALMLVMNLITGVIVARTLGADGRGQLAATLVLVLTATWLFSVGSTEAISFHQAKNRRDAARLIGSWLAVVGVASVVAILVMELVLPVLFSAQTDSAIEVARWYIPLIAVSLAIAMYNGVLLGDEDFTAYNVLRAVIPVGIAIGYGILLLFDEFTVEGALVANGAATTVAALGMAWRTGRRHGIARPDIPLLRRTLWYGLRAHGGSIAGFVNARLDLLILPAFLAAESVGLYSVATNTTSIIGALTGTVAMFVLPVAARRKHGSARTVVKTLQATAMIGLVLAIPMIVLAQFGLELVYGEEFGQAATAMRIMLPGEVLDACSVVLWAGLLAANRPFLSSAAAGPGAVLTIVGLLLFLESGGIDAAAIVSTSVHTLVFIVSISLYRHVQGLRWRDFLASPTA